MSTEALKRFVHCVCLHLAHDELIEKAQLDLMELRYDGLVIAEGERAFVEDLRLLLDDVVRQFPRVEAAVDASASEAPAASPIQQAPILTIETTIADIERVFQDPRWTLLADIAKEIARKKDAQQEKSEQLTTRLQSVDDKKKKLSSLLEAANRVNAPTIREQERLVRINRRYEQAKSSIMSKRAVAYDEVNALLEETQDIDELLSVVREKQEHAKRVRRRADLLLLRSPYDAKDRLHYEALLRTASEPGIHGISLHATSTIVRQDRAEISNRMSEITRLLREGRLRDAAGKATYETREIGVSPIAGASAMSSDSILESAGRFVYRLLLPEAVQQYLSSADCSLSLTTNDLEIPWELMHDGGDFLCIRRPVARMPMGAYLPQERTRFSSDKIRFLFVRPTDDLLGAKDEVEEVKRQVSSLQQNVEVDELGPNEATTQELNRRFESGKYHVIHFAGHAQFDAQDPELSGLVLANREIFFAQKARRLLEGRPLVFLNACESANERAEAESASLGNVSYLQTPAAGLASSFIYGSALGCVGAVWPVNDRSAAHFAVELYRELLNGSMIGEAMRLARERSRKQYPTHVTWASFVLYGDPTFQLLSPT